MSPAHENALDTLDLLRADAVDKLMRSNDAAIGDVRRAQIMPRIEEAVAA